MSIVSTPNNNYGSLAAVRRLQGLALIGALLYPAWGWLLNSVIEGIVDPIGPRLWISGLCVVIFALPYIYPQLNKWITGFVGVVAKVMLCHLYWLVVKNDFSLTYQSVFAIGLVAILAGTPDMRALITASGVVTVLIGSSPFHAVVPFSSIILLWLTAFTAISVIWVIKGEQFTTHSLLFSSEERNRQVFANLLEGLVIQDTTGKFIDCNSAAERILGLSRDEILTRPSANARLKLTDEVGRDLAVERQPPMIAMKTGKAVTKSIIGVQRLTGERRWLQVNSIPIVKRGSQKAQYIVSSFADITDLHDANRKILDQQANLANANRLSAMGEMAAGISHEINNPLSIIRLQMEELEFLLSEAGQPGLIDKVNQTVKAVDRVAKIVRGLRNLSRDSSRDAMAWTDLNSILSEALEVCQQRFVHAGVKLEAQIPPGLSILCQSGQIAQVILNLLQNAFDAVEKQPQKWVRISAHLELDMAVITVTDSGPGIPAELRERIMNPFFTTKEPGRGTGLGLSISRTIVTKHGGTLQLDMGAPYTTFIIRIPKDASTFAA